MERLDELNSFFLHKNNKSFFLFISLFRGWGLLGFTYNYSSFGANIVLYNLFKKVIIKNNYFWWECFGFLKSYLQYLSFLGLGIKSSILGVNKLFLRLGYSHRILLYIGFGFQIKYISRQLLKFSGRSKFFLKAIVFNLKRKRKLNVYKKKGLCLKGEYIFLKNSGKKTAS